MSKCNYFPWAKPVLYNFKNKSEAARDIIDYTLNKVMTMFDADFGDEPIDKRLYFSMLFQCGYTALCRVDDRIYCLFGEPGGWVKGNDFRPQIYTVAISNFNGEGKTLSRRFVVGDDCVIIWNDSTHRGLLPLLRKYAALLSENELSLKRVMILSRMMAFFKAPNQGAADSINQVISDLEDGDLRAAVANDFTGETQALPITNSASATIVQLIELEQYLKAALLNEIGLNANWNGKRETLNTAESEMNEDALIPLPDDMLNNHIRGLEAANDLFGTDFRETFAGVWRTQRTIVEEKTESTTDDKIIADEPIDDPITKEGEPNAEND